MLDMLQAPSPLPPPAPTSPARRSRGDASHAGEQRRAGWVKAFIPIGIRVCGRGVIVLYHEPLMIDAIRVADLIVEQAGENEGDGSRAGAADVGQHAIETRHRERDGVAGRDDDRSE